MSAIRVDDASVRAAVPPSRNMRDLLLRLGLAAYGGNYETMRRRLARLDLLDERFQPQRYGRQDVSHWSVEDLRDATRRATGYAALQRLLGEQGRPLHRRRVDQLVALHGLDTSHFAGSGRRGLRRPRRVPLAEVLVRGRLVEGASLARRLVEEGVLRDCCAFCEGTGWMGAPIPLELDHVNGDRTDNRLENLRLLCPNCHATTPTYRGRNIGRIASEA